MLTEPTPENKLLTLLNEFKSLHSFKTSNDYEKRKKDIAVGRKRRSDP